MQIGSTVLYALTTDDAAQINRRRTTGKAIAERLEKQKWPEGAQAHIGNEVRAGDMFPLIVVRVVKESEHTVAGQLMLDGTDTYWVRETSAGREMGQWRRTRLEA